MTPKEQSIELIGKFNVINVEGGDYTMTCNQIRECALIACQYIINSNPHGNPINGNGESSTMNFWLDVKKEIENYKFEF